VRADRLVAILLMLQSRGKVTATEVAAELEVSERTARRDLDALGTAGVPVYSRQGRGGGWELAGEIAGLAWLIEVLDPPDLRATLLEVGEQLVERYGAEPST